MASAEVRHWRSQWHTMVDRNGREGNGRFAAGNAGGPGRPKKRKELEDATLRELEAAGEGGAELYLAAMVLHDRDEWVRKIEEDFPREIGDRIRTIVALSDLARREIVRRLRDATV